MTLCDKSVTQNGLFIVTMDKMKKLSHLVTPCHTPMSPGHILYHFELFGGSQVMGPLDGAEIGHCHRSHRPWPAMTSLFINYWLTYWPKFKFAVIWPCHGSHWPLLNVKFRRSGHRSQAMPNNSKWYTIYQFTNFTF